MPDSIKDNWFLEAWAKNRDEGLPPYMVITANRLQLSKTALAIVIGEEVLEKVEGRKWDIDMMSFEIPQLFETWKKVPEWTPLTLDEPNRPAGHRSWWTPANNALAEWMQTRAYEHRPVTLPMPHEHLLDSAIAAIVTSHAVVNSKGHATFYSIERDQLNRSIKERTPKSGTLEY